MAFRALKIKKDETEEVVDARFLSEEDRGNRFLCVGTCKYGPHKNDTCKAELTLFICTGKDNYFAATGASEHKKGCEYCEKRIEKIIQILNRSCQDKTDADILSKLQGAKTDRPGKPLRGLPIGKVVPPEAGENDDTEDIDDLIVKRKARLPKNADELYDVLTTLEPDDVFAQKPVSDWIVDKRTFAQYYAAGLKDGQISLVVLGKMSPAKLPEELNAYGDRYYIFPCTGTNWREKLFFLLPKDKYLLQSVIYDKQIKQFAVLAAWHRARTAVQAYYCDDNLLNKKQLTFEPNNQELLS